MTQVFEEPADSTVTILIHPLELIAAGICDLFKVPAIARLLFVKDVMGSLTSSTNVDRWDSQFNIHPRGQHTH